MPLIKQSDKEKNEKGRAQRPNREVLRSKWKIDLR